MKAAPGTNPTRINHLSGTKSVWISQLPLISGTEERLAMDTSSQFSHVISGTEMGLEQRGAVAERVGVDHFASRIHAAPGTNPRETGGD